MVPPVKVTEPASIQRLYGGADGHAHVLGSRLDHLERLLELLELLLVEGVAHLTRRPSQLL